ncbi:MAG: sigma-70 family RNA polymerase sigma factor [Crocinitomicaceae bacterium]|nr:sigma-70 family RNA polymerase sigma factor [Crocinitomicaceae bacterium]
MLFNKRKTYRKLSDKDLISIYKDKPATNIIGEFYTRYGHLVMGVAMKYMQNKFDAEDLTMVVFEKLPQKIETNDIKTFKSWLYMVTKNECLMLLRKKGNRSTEITQEIESVEQLEEKKAKEIQIELLEDAIEILKAEQKECIKLFYLECKSYQEISVLLKRDIKKVKSAIQNGKRNLRINLEGRNEFKSIT